MTIRYSMLSGTKARREVVVGKKARSLLVLDGTVRFTDGGTTITRTGLFAKAPFWGWYELAIIDGRLELCDCLPF